MNGWWAHLIQFLGVVVVVVCATLWLQGALHTIDTRLVKLEVNTAERWSRTDMKLWSQSLALMNRGSDIVVPSISQQGRRGDGDK